MPPFFEKIHDLEMRYFLFDELYDGWSIWRVMRNAVFRKGMEAHWDIAAQTAGDFRRIARAFTMTLKLGFILFFAKRCELLVKTARSGLRARVGDQFRDVYFDGIFDLSLSHFKLEQINTNEFKYQASRARYPGALDPVVFTFWGRVFGSIFPAPVTAFAERLSSLLIVNADIDISTKQLVMRVSTVYWQARFYELLIRRLKPRVVLVSDTGEYGLRIAAGRAGVPFIELQHGVFDHNHPDAIPACVRGSIQELVLPDRLACFGTYWIEKLVDTRQGRDLAIPVGSELIDQARVARAARVKDNCFRILLTTQGMETAALVSWVEEWVSIAPKLFDWRLIIKLHPSYDALTNDYDKLTRNGRVSVVRGSMDPSIFQLLADADMHISIASACHYDAAAIGVPTVVLPLNGHESMLSAIDGRHILGVDTPSDLWGLVLRTKPLATDLERFSKPGFVVNFMALINQFPRA